MTDDLQDRTSADADADTAAKPAPARLRAARPSPAAATPADVTDEVEDTPEVGLDDPTTTTPVVRKAGRPATPTVRRPSPANVRRQAKKEMARRAAEARRRAKRRRQAITYSAVAAAVVVILVGGFLIFGGGHGKKTPAAGAPSNPVASVSLDPALSTAPTVTKGDGTLTELKVTTLITGTGPKVASGQTITVNYTGVTYADGKQFDSSWKNGQPASFPIGVGKVIKGWDQGLVGVTVGSRVQLDIPSALAYGDSGNPAGPLRFVVDILSASDSAAN